MPSLVEIGPVVQEKKIFKFCQCIFAFFFLSPLGKRWDRLFEKFESHLPKDALCQVWLKFAQWFWRRRFFNFVNVFSLFRDNLSLEKDVALHLNTLEPFSPKDALCQVWLKLAPLFWKRRFLNFVNIISLFRYYLSLKKDVVLHLPNSTRAP